MNSSEHETLINLILTQVQLLGMNLKLHLNI